MSKFDNRCEMTEMIIYYKWPSEFIIPFMQEKGIAHTESKEFLTTSISFKFDNIPSETDCREFATPSEWCSYNLMESYLKLIAPPDVSVKLIGIFKNWME